MNNRSKSVPIFAAAKRAAVVVAIACAAGFGVGAPTAGAQSLNTELELLIQTHPRIEEQRAILRRAQESVRSSRSGYLPSVTSTGSAGIERKSDSTTRTAGDDDDRLRFNALGIEVRQNLFDADATDSAVGAALMARDSVAFALEGTVQQVMLQGITAYLNVLKLNELIRVSKARERTIREQLNLETERVDRGAGIAVDVLQAKSRLQLAIEQRVDLEGQLRQAVAAYIQSFQREPDITRMRVEPTPPQLLPANLDDALFIARQENPLVAARAFLARSARFSIDVQKAGYFPTVDFVGRLDHEKDVAHTRGYVKTAAVLIEMSWDIFSGFATDAAVASAQQSLLENLSIADRTLRETERQVRQSWTKLENTRVRKELLLNAVSIAQEVFSARQKLRDAGKDTAINVLDSENEVFQAEQNLIRADYDARAAVYELATAMGIMSPAVLGMDVQVIEDFGDYKTGDGDVDDLEPDPTVENRREQIDAIRRAAGIGPYEEQGPAPTSEPQDTAPVETAPGVIEPPPSSSEAPQNDTAPAVQDSAALPALRQIEELAVLPKPAEPAAVAVQEAELSTSPNVSDALAVSGTDQASDGGFTVPGSLLFGAGSQ